MFLVGPGIMYTAIILIVIVLIGIFWLTGKLDKLTVSKRELKLKYDNLLKKYNDNISEKNGKISDLNAQNGELNKAVQYVWNIIKGHRYYKKFSGKGGEVGVITAGIIGELENEIKSLGITIENRDKKINAQKSTIHRRDMRIKKLLLPVKPKKKVCQKKKK